MQRGFKEIPFQRLVLYLLALPFLPLAFLGFDAYTKMQELKRAEQYCQSVEFQKLEKKKKQAVNDCVKSHYAVVDADYLQKKLGGLTLLKKEREATEKLKEKITLPTNESFEHRYRFLVEQNKLHFHHQQLALQEGIQETLFSLTHPVEIEVKDLQEILSLIEEKQEMQPQLIVTDLTLKKHTTVNQTEVYELTLQLLQREFNP